VTLTLPVVEVCFGHASPLVPEDLHRNGNRLLAEQRRSLNRALAAVVLGRMSNKRAGEVLKAHWPGDDAAQWRAPRHEPGMYKLMAGNQDRSRRI
jgi:hypothetical protein